MEKQVYIIWECDAWLTKSNRVCMGVFDSLELAFDEIINEMSENDLFDEENGLDEDEARENLANYHQTQGFDTNYHIDTITLNEFNEI